MSISLTPPLSRPTLAAPARARAARTAIPWYIYAVSLASLLTIIGILWDISWHRSIGRDKFLSPPHILIYLGAIFAGLFSGVQVLWNSFRPTEQTKAGMVRVWGIFYSSLGALFCIWGAIAMLTSAPFDDWWHSAYGLDVVILSPPHVLLGLGMLFLQFGACVCISKYLNTGEDTPGATATGQRALLSFLFVVSAASLLSMVYTLGTAYLDNRGMRGPLFYEVAALVTLLFLPAFGRALPLRWGMTAIALCYTAIISGSSWVLQLFPAEPKLGPILYHVTHFQPGNFPLLILAPALVMDWVMRSNRAGEWLRSFLLSLSFILIMLLLQYPFSGFLLESPGARNWFFGAEAWYFGDSPVWPYRYKFLPNEIAGGAEMSKGIGIALVLGFFAARLSLRWGKWMRSVQR